MKTRLFIVLVAMFALSACGAGAKAITEGTLQDTIFSVEPRVNGSYSVWMTHDDVGVYCTVDKALGDKALTIVKSDNPKAIITYRSVNNSDPEYAWLGDTTGGGCATERGGSAKPTVYKLLSITQVGAKE